MNEKTSTNTARQTPSRKPSDAELLRDSRGLDIGTGLVSEVENLLTKQTPRPSMASGANSRAQSSFEIRGNLHASTGLAKLLPPGLPLHAASRSFFEAWFGHDFSQVRIHADDRAGESAQAAQALAYTSGSHIVFGRGQYRPWTMTGQRLLAHELVHVVQQGAVAFQPSRFSHPDDAEEREAERIASEFSLSAPLSMPNRESRVVGTLYRATEPPPAGLTPPTPRRIVYLDASVFDQINRGNQAAAEALRNMCSSGVDIRISEWTYREMVEKPELPRTAVANRLLIQELGINVDPLVPFQRRVDLTLPNQLSRGRTLLSPEDAQVVMGARAGGGEIWSFDRAFRNDPQNIRNTFGVNVAPESSLSLNPRSPAPDYRVGRRLLSLQPVEITVSGVVRTPGSSGGGPGSAGGGPGRSGGQGAIGGGSTLPTDIPSSRASGMGIAHSEALKLTGKLKIQTSRARFGAAAIQTAAPLTNMVAGAATSFITDSLVRYMQREVQKMPKMNFKQFVIGTSNRSEIESILQKSGLIDDPEEFITQIEFIENMLSIDIISFIKGREQDHERIKDIITKIIDKIDPSEDEQFVVETIDTIEVYLQQYRSQIFSEIDNLVIILELFQKEAIPKAEASDDAAEFFDSTIVKEFLILTTTIDPEFIFRCHIPFKKFSDRVRDDYRRFLRLYNKYDEWIIYIDSILSYFDDRLLEIGHSGF